MKYIKSLFLFSFCFILSVKGYSNSSIQNEIDSLKETVFLKNEDLTPKKEGETLNRISKYYLLLGDVENAKIYNWKSLRTFHKSKNYRSVLKVLLDLGNLESINNRFDKSIRFYFAAEEILEAVKYKIVENDYKFLHGMILMHIGIIYEETQNYNQALTYLHEAHDNLLKGGVDSSYMAVIYTNLGMTYGRLDQFDLVKEYSKKAITYYSDNELDQYSKTIVYNNLGKAYFLEKNYEAALASYNQSLNYYKNQDKFLKNYVDILASITDVYIEINDIANAKKYLDKAINTSEKLGKDQLNVHIYGSKVKYYTKINKPQLALDNLKSLNKVKYNRYHPEVIANIARYQRDYDLKKVTKENQLKVQLLEQEQLLDVYKWYAFVGVFFLFFLISLLFIYRQKNKINLKNMSLENYKSKQEQLNDKIKFKNNQLTNYAMYILKKNDFLEELKKEIDNVKTTSENTLYINPLSSLVNQHINNSKDRKDFEIRIERENQDFYFKLQKNFPNLNEKDKKLCSLLLLELSSKEMAALLNISVGSVEKSRHRLRKKLTIDSEISLSKFLNNL